MMKVWKEFSKGLWQELAPFKILLGLCPTLAVTTKAENGFGMGMAVLGVLTTSNFLVSLLRNVIPKKVRIASYVAISATLVVGVELLMQAFAFELYEQLGIFVALIVVNCIILGRAEAFASKNTVLLSVADGVGIGLGFAFSLTLIASVREILGLGTFFGIALFGDSFEPFSVLQQGPGGFIVFGVLLALLGFANALSLKAKQRVTDPTVLVSKGTTAQVVRL
ncbi:MAG: electron transport complex subunit RsxE [Desulfovibrionaceae bacterium]